MGDLVKMMAEEWARGLKAQKEILDGIRPNDERVTYRREQLMMEGLSQIQAESLARQEVAELEMEALGIGFDAEKLKAGVAAAAAQLPYGAHTHTDPAQNTVGCAACLTRENRARHRAHINASLQMDNTCPTCIDSEAKLNENDTKLMTELLKRKAAGGTLSKKEKKKLNKLLAATVPATVTPDEPPGPGVRRGFSPATWWPFQMAKLHANLEIIASVNDLPFITAAITDVQTFITTRLGDLHELNGLGRDGKERTPEAPLCENGPKCKLKRFHYGACDLWPSYKENTESTAMVAVTVERGDHATDCPCPGCDWDSRKQTRPADARTEYCVVHRDCDHEQKDCRITWATGTATTETAVVEGKQLTLIQGGASNNEVRIHTNYDNGKPAHVINVIGQTSGDDDRVFRYKCLQSPSGTDTSKLDHLWYATLDAKFKQNICPECKARPRLAEAKPLSGSQFKAWKLGQEKLNAPQV